MKTICGLTLEDGQPCMREMMYIEGEWACPHCDANRVLALMVVKL